MFLFLEERVIVVVVVRSLMFLQNKVFFFFFELYMFSYLKVHLLFESFKIDQIIFYIINVGMKGPDKDIGHGPYPMTSNSPRTNKY